MNIFELSARITADTTDFDNKVGNMVSSGVKKFAALTTAAGAAVAAFAGKKAIETGMEFDKAMSQVQATMLKTNEEMEASVGRSSSAYGEFTGNLREFAQFLGENTVFSATQAAEALNYMALAGYDTQQSMDMLPNVLSLAAAGNFDLARASDMVTDAQTAFGISADRTTQMVDEMAKASSITNTSVEQMGDAFLVVGANARDLNGGFITLSDGTKASVDGLQEMEIALGAMASAGVKGSEAGTHMRNMLLKLSDPTKEGAETFEELGVRVFDAEGNMRSLTDIFGDLNNSLSNLTQEEKIKAISAIFNTRDQASAKALLSAISQDWNEIGEGILNAKGAAGDMSKIQLDNLSGDVTLMKSAMEGLQIAISDEVTPSLRDFIQKATGWIGGLTEKIKNGGLRDAIEKVRETWEKIKTALAPVGEAFKNVFKAVGGGKGIMNGFSKALDIIIKAISITAKVLAFVINKIAKFIEWLKSGSKPAERFKAIIIGLSTGLAVLLGIIKGYVIIQKIISSIQALSGVMAFLAANPIVLIIAAIVGLISALVYLYNNNEEFREKVQEIWTAIQEFFGEAAEKIKAIWEGVVEFFTLAWEGIKLVWDTVGEYFSNIWETIKTIFGVVADVFTGDFQGAWEGIQSIVDMWGGYFSGIWEGIKSIWDAVDSWFGEKFGTAWDAIKQVIDLWIEYFQNIWESIKLIFDVVADVFQGDFEGAWENIQKIVDLWEGYFSDVWEAIKGVFKPVVDWFRGKFEDAWEAIKGVFQPVIDFFQGIWDDITGVFDGIGEEISGFFDWDWNSIGANIINGIAGGVTDAGAGLWNSIWGAVNSAWNNLLSWLGIASPSKKARDKIGKMWSRGIGVGFVEGMPTEDMVGAVEDAFDEVSDIDPVDFGVDDYSVSSFNTGSSRRTGTESSGVVINVYATERQDEEEIAREVQRVFIQWENQRRAAYA